MEIQLINSQFVAKCTFAEKDIPKNAGFRWSPASKFWFTDDPKNAAKLSEYCNREVKEKIYEGIIAERIYRLNSNEGSGVRSEGLRSPLCQALRPAIAIMTALSVQRSGLGRRAFQRLSSERALRSALLAATPPDTARFLMPV